MTEPLRPPSHLQTEGRRFWEAMTGEYDFDVHELRLLRLTCEQIDIQNQARKAIRKQGLTIINPKSGAVKPNPALSVDRQATRLIQSLLRQLAIPTDDEARPYAGRTPGGRKHRAPRRTRGTP